MIHRNNGKSIYFSYFNKILEHVACSRKKCNIYIRIRSLFNMYVFITRNAFDICIKIERCRKKKWKTFCTFVRMFVHLYRNKRALFNCMFADISVFFIALGPFYSCFRAINHDSPSFNSFDRHHVCILFQPKLARA